MTFTAVVCSHANERGLRYALGNLLYQSRKPDEIIVCCSDTPGLPRLREHFPAVTFVEHDNRNDWGHEKRADGLARATMEWVGFFNDDDSYSGEYLAKMLGCAEQTGADVVYCGWNKVPHCEFRIYQSTSGNFICRTELGRRVGYTERRYEADGDFIEGLVEAGARIARVSETLYFHNCQ